MSREDDFENSSYALENIDEVETNGSSEELEGPPPKNSISKKAAKKRDARRRIEDYLELRRVKSVIEEYGNKNMESELLHWFEEPLNSDSRAEKNK